MRKTLTLALAVALFGVLAAVVVAQGGQETAPSGTSATTETTGTTETTETTTDETTSAPTTTAEDNPDRVREDIARGEDVSGPCDEAEHATDPRCTGVVADDHGGREDRGDDNSGPGSLNSGPGSLNSGHDDDDDEVFDADDDSSGSGHSGGNDSDDGGSSGHGGDDSD
jgi:hypothetical protein